MSKLELLKFRCTGCGNCCKEPLLPLTDADLMRLVRHTGEDPMKLVKFISRDEIDLDHEPDAFALLRQGKRVMVLKHRAGRCVFLGSDDRCSVYDARPLGCRIFPFDPTFTKSGKLIRLRMIQATECPYELDGSNSVAGLRRLNTQYEAAIVRYRTRIAEWNTMQRGARRRGRRLRTGRDYLNFLGVVPPRDRKYAAG
jgi:Fe-S-cluster containining protein